MGWFGVAPDQTDGAICPYDIFLSFFFLVESQLGAFISRGGCGVVVDPRSSCQQATRTDGWSNRHADMESSANALPPSLMSLEQSNLLDQGQRRRRSAKVGWIWEEEEEEEEEQCVCVYMCACLFVCVSGDERVEKQQNKSSLLTLLASRRFPSIARYDGADCLCRAAICCFVLLGLPFYIISVSLS